MEEKLCFIEEIKKIADRVAKYSDSISTEEATKQALVLPFIDLLGFTVMTHMKLAPNIQLTLVSKKEKRLIMLL